MKKNSNVKEVAKYIAPMIEVYDIVLDQSVLLAASGGGDTPGTPGGPWG